MNTPNNTINNGQAGTKHEIHINNNMDGWLACDNKLFDRTCPSCRGMYSSYEVANCPKCGTQLTYITTGKGQAMAISEGTFYPCLSQKQKEKDLKNLQDAGNGIEATYRFKMFSFADANGVLAPPPEHAFCKKGALINIRMINHQVLHRLFSTKEGVAKVEVLHLIWKNYGDHVKLIREPQNISYQVNADGSPAPMTPPFTNAQAAGGTDAMAMLNQLMQQVQTLQAQINGGNAQPQAPVQPQVPVQTPAPVQPQTLPAQPQAVVASGEIDPFSNAV